MLSSQNKPFMFVVYANAVRCEDNIHRPPCVINIDIKD